MCIMPDNPYASLTVLQRRLYDRVVYIAEQCGEAPVKVLYEGLCGAVLASDVAAIHSALIGAPVTVEQVREQLVGGA